VRGREESAKSFNGPSTGTWSACRRIGFTFLSVAGLTWVVGCTGTVLVSGLRPHYPEPAPKFVEVDSLRPMLRWEPFPRPQDREVDKDGNPARIREVTYDLRIWRAELEHPIEYPAELIYSRRGLPDPEHRVEEPLKPSTKYFWSIRARFELDGQPRVTQWGVMRLAIVLPHPGHYRFKTPSR